MRGLRTASGRRWDWPAGRPGNHLGGGETGGSDNACEKHTTCFHTQLDFVDKKH